MGLFKKLLGVAATAAVVAGGYYIYKNKDNIQNKIKAKKQNIALDLEVFNKAHEEYQNALNAQSKLEEETQYFDEYSKYYTLLKESYVKVQHDILSAQANQDEQALVELNELKHTISTELEEGLQEFEKVSAELDARAEDIESAQLAVDSTKQLYDAAKENIQAHGKRYLKGIVDPVKKVIEQEFKTFELEETVEEIKEDVQDKVVEISEDVKEKFDEIKEEKLPEITTPLNQAIDKTQESISRLLNTIKK